jgi:hypothetical protein
VAEFDGHSWSKLAKEVQKIVVETVAEAKQCDHSSLIEDIDFECVKNAGKKLIADAKDVITHFDG